MDRFDSTTRCERPREQGPAGLPSQRDSHLVLAACFAIAALVIGLTVADLAFA
jgi:hypothetical protein